MTSITTSTALGEQVRARRKELGLSQIELAGLSGVGPRLVGEIEAGKPTAQIGKILRVLQRLGLGLTVTRKNP